MSDPIQFAISEAVAGADTASTIYAGRTFTASSRNGASMKLARLLVAAGCPDQPVEVRWPDGAPRFSARSLHRLAELTITEPDAGALRIVSHRECHFPRMRAALGGVSGAGRPEIPPEPEKPLARRTS